MVESLSVGESVTVEVTRASPFSNAASTVTSAVSAPQIPGEYLVVFFGAIVAIAFVLLAVRKHLKLTRSNFSPKKVGLRISRTERMIEKSFRWGNLLKAVGISASIGIVGMMLTGTGFMWALAAVFFYREFLLRRSR